MNDLDHAPICAATLRDFVERLRAHAGVDEHPLTRVLAVLPGFREYASDAAGRPGSGRHAARWLRAVWRQHFMPPALSAARQVKWNAFFILEVTYFFPSATGRPYPGTLKDTAILLCDEAHLALVIADGDDDLAGRLLRDNRAFWQAIIPAAMVPADQTLHSRRNASLAKLASELNRQLAEAGAEPVHRASRDIAVQAKPASVADATAQHSQQDQQSTSSHGDAPLEVAPIPAMPNSPIARRLLAAYAGPLPSRTPGAALMAPAMVAAEPRERLRQMAGRVAGITPTELDELAVWLEALGFSQRFGVTRPYADGVWWWDDVYHQRALIETFEATNCELTRLQCAAALRQSSLSVPVEASGNLWLRQGGQWMPALQAIADVAVRSHSGTSRHALGRAVLARREFLMRLSALGTDYGGLVVDISNVERVGLT
jgi:hypothetical protein